MLICMLTNLGGPLIDRVRYKATTRVFPFDDYAHRGFRLAGMCMYNYVSLVYESSDTGGLPFDTSHPQHLTYQQFVQKANTAIPTLLGRLLFL
jgi:hypothetical protein